MNLRNRYILITIRTLLGLFFIFSGVSGLIAGRSMDGVPEPMVQISQSLWTSGIFQMIKITEIVAGLMLATGVLSALGAIFLVPICVGVIVFNAMLAPNYLPMGIIVSVLVAYLGYAYWDKYKAIFEYTHTDKK